MDNISADNRNLLGWAGTVCLLFILPIKLLRHFGGGDMVSIGIAPSILGPAGFLFLLLSSPRVLSRWTLLQTTLLAGAVAVGLELLQLVPRPGFLSRVRYTFDHYDLVASLLSLLVAYLVVRWIILRPRSPESSRGTRVNLRPRETDLTGSWPQNATGRTEEDATCKRIQTLVSEVLTFVGDGDSGWSKLYRDPSDGRLWELTYPHSGWHGGGPPRLTYMTPEAATRKYTDIGRDWIERFTGQPARRTRRPESPDSYPPRST